MLLYLAMEYQNKVALCLALIKEQVKTKAIGYQQLADSLGVSLLTIKRQLNGDDLSMSKLLALCDAAGVNFIEIIQRVESRKASHTFFTAEQDQAFCKYPHLFHYFVELLHQQKSPGQLQREWHLTPASTHMYLRKLEQLSLISLSMKSDVTFLVDEPLGFGPGSQFVKKDIRNALIDVSDRIGVKSLDDVFVIAKPLILSHELREKMYVELTEVISRYAELSERYFTQSEHPAFQMVVCDYQMQEATPLCDIVNVSKFD